MPALTALNLACGLSLTDEACDVNSKDSRRYLLSIV